MAGADAALDLIRPDWPAPARVCAVATTRTGGVSTGPYAALNLGAHVQDNPAAVTRNRELLQSALGLATPPVWLNQVHGTTVVTARTGRPPPQADAATSCEPGVVCAILTADCLPVLFCNRAGTHVAAAHAGWRGLAAGLLEATVAALGAAGAPAGSLLAWLGPAIGPLVYEVGSDVRNAFLRADPGAAAAFVPNRPGHWLLDLYGAARGRLHRAGVTTISGGTHCTLTEADRFYSHRRDAQTGRQATLIWLLREPARSKGTGP